MSSGDASHDANGRTPQSARITQIETDVGLLKADVGSLKADFKILGNTVKEVAIDIASSSRRQEELHEQTRDRQEAFQKEWRDQKTAEKEQEDAFARSRQIGPVQAIQMAAAAAALVGALLTGFFFLMKAYIDGSTTPAITQLTERQNATTDANGRRQEAMDDLRATVTAMVAKQADIDRIALDNRDTINQFREVAAKSADDRARLDERLKAERELMMTLQQAEANARKAGDDALRDELRMYKGRADHLPLPP